MISKCFYVRIDYDGILTLTPERLEKAIEKYTELENVFVVVKEYK